MLALETERLYILLCSDITFKKKGGKNDQHLFPPHCFQNIYSIQYTYILKEHGFFSILFLKFLFSLDFFLRSSVDECKEKLCRPWPYSLLQIVWSASSFYFYGPFVFRASFICRHVFIHKHLREGLVFASDFPRGVTLTHNCWLCAHLYYCL